MSSFPFAFRAPCFTLVLPVLIVLHFPANVFGTSVTRLREALSKPTDANYSGTPLTEVIQDLESQHGIEIEVDTRAFENIGITAEMVVVSRELHGVSLSAVLDLVLRDNDLTYLIRDEVLLLTTMQRAKQEVSVQLYRVADLADDDAELDAVRDQISQLFTPESEERMLKLAVISQGGILAIRTDELLHREIRDFLQSLRTQLSEPDKQLASSDSVTIPPIPARTEDSTVGGLASPGEDPFTP